MNRLQSSQKGVSLIELMIVIVIIAVLASVAIPSYQNQIRSTHRDEAKSALMSMATAMERFHVQGNTYDGSAAALLPASTESGLYTITIPTATQSTYTLRATPVAASSQDGDGYLELDHLGVKSWQKNGGAVVNTWE